MGKEELQPVDDGWRIPDALWQRIGPLLPPERPKPKGGRPRAPSRQCLDGIFYILRTGPPRRVEGFTTLLRSRKHGTRSLPGVARSGGLRETMVRLGRSLTEYDEQLGLEWEWQAMDGAMTKAPLGG